MCVYICNKVQYIKIQLSFLKKVSPCWFVGQQSVQQPANQEEEFTYSNRNLSNQHYRTWRLKAEEEMPSNVNPFSNLLHKQLNVDYFTKCCFPALYVQFFWDVIVTEFMWNDPTLNLLHWSPLDVRGVKPGWPQSKQHLASWGETKYHSLIFPTRSCIRLYTVTTVKES